MKGAHVFAVDKYSFPVHRSRGFCGVKHPKNLSTRYGLYADLKAVRVGDLVFFYQFRVDEPQHLRGFRGIYEATTEAFYDTTKIEWGDYTVLGKCPSCGTSYSEKEGESSLICQECGESIPEGRHILPNRILIKSIKYYENPVDDNTAYINHTDRGTLPTMVFRKVYGRGRERSITHILPEEAEKLTRLLERVNNGQTSTFDFQPYPQTDHQPITLDLGRGGEVRYESLLEAWMMENIDKNYPVLKDVVGDLKELEYFGNNVLYGIGGDKVDVLLLHKHEVRYKATAIELKKGVIDRASLEQIDRYSYWVSQLATANAEPTVKVLTLQPVVVGHTVDSRIVTQAERMPAKKLTIPYPTGACEVKVLPPILMTYDVQDGKMSFKMQTGREDQTRLF